MVFVPPKDRVLEHSITNSQSVFIVSGALDLSYNAFSASMSVGDTTIGAVVEPGVAFKAGLLTYSASNEVTVTTAYDSKGTFSAGGVKEVFMGMPASDALMFDGAQTLTSTQQAQARSNLDAASLAAMASRNAAINAAVDVSQELLAVGATLATTVQKYTADMWAAFYTHGAGTAVVVSKQMTMVSLGVPLAGFQNGHMIQATTAISSPANGDAALHRHFFEGSRIAHWGWGATGAASVSVAFQFYSTASGVAFVRLSNGATANRFYYHEITVAAGWNFVSFLVPGDTTGIWATDTTKALTVDIFSAGKETTPQASLNSWGATGKLQTTNSTNLLGTNNNATLVTGLYVDANGGQLPLAGDLPLLMRPFDQELELCKRHYRKTFPYATAPAQNAGLSGAIGRVIVVNAVNNWVNWRFSSSMRITPTITSYNPSAANTSWAGGSANAYATVDVSADHLLLGGGAAGPSGDQIHIVADARM